MVERLVPSLYKAYCKLKECKDGTQRLQRFVWNIIAQVFKKHKSQKLCVLAFSKSLEQYIFTRKPIQSFAGGIINN